MNIHAWITAAAPDLDPDNVWRAYQNSGHELSNDVDVVTYFEANRGNQTAIHLDREYLDEEDVSLSRHSETSYVYTIRVFGPNRAAISLRIRQGALEDEPRQALVPGVFQSVADGPRPVREERAPGWLEYITFNVLIFEFETTVETVPAIQGSDITGTVGGVELEVIEP